MQECSPVYLDTRYVDIRRKFCAKAGGLRTLISIHIGDTGRRYNPTSFRRPVIPVITILPEYGCAYGWIKREGGVGERYVGPNFADELFGWALEVDIPDALHRAFVAWVARFERVASQNGYDDDAWPRFPWGKFHREGLRLTRQVAARLGDRYIVIYMKPYEDPHRETLERRQVMPNGRLIPRQTSPRRSG